jgi:hypothetical protein
MQESKAFLRSLGLPDGDAHSLPSSTKRFPDGAQYRVEIPSVEGPAVMASVIEACGEFGVQIHRISQGSGIMLLTDAEIRQMAELGRAQRWEVSLFVGPRAGWEVSATALTPAGKNIGARHRGMDQVVYALEDIKRAVGLGIRGVLVADEGLLWLTRQAKERGYLPKDLVVKVSVQMGAANPVSIRLAQESGAGTYNPPTDLTLAQLAAIRQAIDIPLDVYMEVPDDFGGFVRHYEIPELVRVAAPVYLKFGLRNAVGIYPSGTHIEPLAVAQARERVRRASLGLSILRRYYPEATTSQPGAPDLAIPLAV